MGAFVLRLSSHGGRQRGKAGGQPEWAEQASFFF